MLGMSPHGGLLFVICEHKQQAHPVHIAAVTALHRSKGTIMATAPMYEQSRP
jgi:hypothetical protein